MASESSEKLTVSVELPAELIDWLDDEAAATDVDRDTMVAQLLASYRTITELDGELDDTGAVLDTNELVEAIDSELGERINERVETIVAEEIQQQVESAVAEEVELQVETLVSDRLTEETNGVKRQLRERIDSVEGEFTEKLQDVRQRVIQVKKETDKKSPADHTHPELERLSVLRNELDSLRDELQELRTNYEETVPEQRDQTAEHAERLEELQDRLQTVAWVVSDLREAQQSSSGLEAVERIKRAAARADIDRANCENCGESVLLALMTDPHCPHCDATVTNVEPASGWFGNSTLTVASQLESGEER